MSSFSLSWTLDSSYFIPNMSTSVQLSCSRCCLIQLSCPACDCLCPGTESWYGVPVCSLFCCGACYCGIRMWSMRINKQTDTWCVQLYMLSVDYHDTPGTYKCKLWFCLHLIQLACGAKCISMLLLYSCSVFLSTLSCTPTLLQALRVSGISALLSGVHYLLIQAISQATGIVMVHFC